MRVSFLNVNHFAHLNREMVKEEFDVALKRDVIAIKSQRVPLHLVHVFSNVTPGNILKTNTYRKVASSRRVYSSILDPLGQWSQYISIKFPLHKRSENMNK